MPREAVEALAGTGRLGASLIRSALQLRAVARAATAGGLLVLLSLAGCGERGETDLALEGTLLHLPSPGLPGSGEPNLAVDGEGRVYLNWFDRLAEGGHALRMASLDLTPAEVGTPAELGADGLPEWSEPRTIVTGRDFFVNWADFPSILPLGNGTLAAHWLVRSGPDTFDYGVHVGWSTDDGRSWEGPVVPHRDGTLSEHGFVSLFPWDFPVDSPAGSPGGGTVGMVWLDGREYVRSPDAPRMTLRFTTLGLVAGGEEWELEAGLGDEVLLDARACDCCQTSAAITADGPIVAYRDRTEDEIRDISVIRHGPDGWGDSEPVHRDGWEIPACPVNGPMIAASGRDVVVAWFTAANGQPRVWVAFSTDGGRGFGLPIRIDEGNPVGRVAVVMEESGRAAVSWLERLPGEEGAEVRVRRVDPQGNRGPFRTIAASSEARASGFPRMVRSGGILVFAWKDLASPGKVQVALLPLEAGS